MAQIKELKAKSWKDKAMSEIKEALKAVEKGVFVF